MSNKINIVKTTWKLWIIFFVFIISLLLIEQLFRITLPDQTIYIVIMFAFGIYAFGYYASWKNKRN